jgi:hypothetical protein
MNDQATKTQRKAEIESTKAESYLFAFYATSFLVFLGVFVVIFKKWQPFSTFDAASAR